MIEFEKPNIKCLEIDNETNYAKFEYIVKTSKIVNETDLNSLEKDYDLILYTCYPNKELYGNKRLIIYAKLDKTKWVGES